MTRYLFLLAIPALAQLETRTSTSSSYSETIHTTHREREAHVNRTRLFARSLAGKIVYDRTFDLPFASPEVKAAVKEATAALLATPNVARVQAPVRTKHLTATDKGSLTVRDKVDRTVGVTRRETIGPANIYTGALSTERNPCTTYRGGTPIAAGGLAPGDGYQFHFTTPVEACLHSGFRVYIPEGTRNIDTLTHVHVDGYLTETVTHTLVEEDTYEITAVARKPPPAMAPPPREDLGILTRYVSNLDRGDATIYLTNSGARGAGLAAGTNSLTTGAICVNVYAFTTDDELAACCSCPVTPNGLATLSVRREIANSTLKPAPTALIVKLYPTTPIGGSCANSAANPGLDSPGLHAWATTLLQTKEGYSSVIQSEFLHTSSTIGERDILAARCTKWSAEATPSGYNICRGCAYGAADAGRY